MLYVGFLAKYLSNTQILQLKEQLGEATREIQRLSDGTISSNSPISSSISTDPNTDPPFFGEFGVEGYETDVFYVSEAENNYNYIQSMEWFNWYL